MTSPRPTAANHPRLELELEALTRVGSRPGSEETPAWLRPCAQQNHLGSFIKIRMPKPQLMIYDSADLQRDPEKQLFRKLAGWFRLHGEVTYSASHRWLMAKLRRQRTTLDCSLSWEFPRFQGKVLKW